MDAQEIASRIEAVRRDEARGATQLAGEAVRLLADMATDATLPDDLFADLFPQTARHLARARPSMASLLNAVGKVMAAWLEGGGAARSGPARAEAAEAARRWLAASEADLGFVADHAAETISGSVIALSYSSTVVRALEECWERGVLTGAIVAESRPLFEGRRTAAALASKGIPTVLITDAQIGIFVSGVSAAVVGADSLLPTGYLVNKAGTNLLALAARRSRIPFYALADTQKILPWRRDRAAYSLEERDPSELLPKPIPGVAVRNVAFDLTTAGYVTGYITEKGLLDRQDIRALSRQASGLVLLGKEDQTKQDMQDIQDIQDRIL